MSNEMRLLSICAQTGLQGGRNIPVMIEGAPGIGKTQVIVKMAEELSVLMKKPFPAEVFTAPQRMPEEVGGIPVPFIEENEVRCLPMRIGKNLLKAGRGIMFIDEYSSANQAMGGACMTMIQDHRLGDLELPHEVAMIAAMNPPECAANGRALTAPESNRFVWVKWNLQLDDWIDYMQGGRGTVAHAQILPPKWEDKFRHEANGLVISFLRRNQALFDVNKTCPKAHDASKPWASPRSWENAARLIAACNSIGERPDSDITALAVTGTVGEGPGDAFLGWFRDMDIPDPEELLRDPKGAKALLPVGRPDKLQVCLESVSNAAIKEHDKLTKRWEAAWEIIGPVLETEPDNALYAAKILASAIARVPDAKTPESAGTVRELLKRIGLK